MTDTDTTRAILITMPHSHYSEKARWALDWLALPYREEPHAPLLHMLATTRHGGRSVPVLVHGASHFVDSTDIAEHADAVRGGDRLYPRDEQIRREVDLLEAQFDDQLGPHVRRWAYAQLLPESRLLRRMMTHGVPWLEASLLPALMPLVRHLVRTQLRITPESAQRSIEHVRRIFREVDIRLGDGRRFLVGNRFSIADLTFAALAAPVLFPPGCRAAYPALDEVPAVMREEVLRLRDTDAGRFALRLYLQDRDPTARTSAR